MNRIIKNGYGTKISKEFSDRLCSFYSNEPTDITNLSDVWFPIFEQKQKTFHEILLSGNYSHVSEWMYRLYETEVVYGLDATNSLIDFGQYNPLTLKHDNDTLQKINSVPWLIFLASCAVGIANFPLKDSEIPNIENNMDSYVADLSAALGIQIGITQTMGMWYSESGGKKIIPRTAYFLPVYSSIRRLLPNGGNVLELGSGTGKLAHLIAQDKKMRYHSCDLPLASVVLAAFVEQQFGESKVWLQGETENPDAIVSVHGSSIPDSVKFDLVVNQDSIPEMPRDVAKQYIRSIESQLNTGGYFLSINQETTSTGQNPVLPMVNEVCSKMRLLYRCPCWNRPGYVEQCWVKI